MFVNAAIMKGSAINKKLKKLKKQKTKQQQKTAITTTTTTTNNKAKQLSMPSLFCGGFPSCETALQKWREREVVVGRWLGRGEEHFWKLYCGREI